MKLNEEQKDFIIGLLEQARIEYGEFISQLIDKINKEETKGEEE